MVIKKYQVILKDNKIYKTLFKTPQRAIREVGITNVLQIKEINTYVDEEEEIQK
jgi:hypothetical protein